MTILNVQWGAQVSHSRWKVTMVFGDREELPPSSNHAGSEQSICLPSSLTHRAQGRALTNMAGGMGCGHSDARH